MGIERRIDLSNLDLDRAAATIAARRDGWVELGLTVHPITWMDNEAKWPRPLPTERSQVRRPMSLGLHVEGSGAAEAEVVLYAGGWADVAVVASSSTEPHQEYVELDDADEFGELLDRMVSRMVRAR